MAEIKETKTVTITQTSVVDEICDKCGKSLYDELAHYERFQSTFEIEEGFSYPEGGMIGVKTMQLCTDCTDEAISLLTNSGFKFIESTKFY